MIGIGIVTFGIPNYKAHKGGANAGGYLNLVK